MSKWAKEINTKTVATDDVRGESLKHNDELVLSFDDFECFDRRFFGRLVGPDIFLRETGAPVMHTRLSQ